MDRHSSSLLALSCCHGYRVAAGALLIGEVETPIFCGPSVEPEFLLVRTVREISGTFRFVPVSLVLDVDREERRLALVGDGEAVTGLPENLPLRGRPRIGEAAV